MTLKEKTPLNKADILLYSENKLDKPYIYVSDVEVKGDSLNSEQYLIKK